MRPLWASTTWNPWMRSRFSVSQTSMRSVSPRADERERLQQVVGAEVLAGGEELALVLGAALGIPPAPRRVHLQEGVLDEVTMDMAAGVRSG